MTDEFVDPRSARLGRCSDANSKAPTASASEKAAGLPWGRKVTVRCAGEPGPSACCRRKAARKDIHCKDHADVPQSHEPTNDDVFDCLRNQSVAGPRRPVPKSA